MKGFWKKICTAVLALTMTFSLAACGGGSKTTDSGASQNATEGSESASSLDTSKTVKIGVLVSDATSAEALA
ncbi:MAG: hypothetical protein K5853_04700, partial [Lachnospiraceae bacterium]|nr:hypothetical protein [Lachnospiraceae bacterium]